MISLARSLPEYKSESSTGLSASALGGPGHEQVALGTSMASTSDTNPFAGVPGDDILHLRMSRTRLEA